MSAPPPPTLSDILTALAAMRQPPPPPADERGIAKHAATIVVTVIGGLCLWVGSSVTGLNTTVTRMTATVEQVVKALSELQESEDALKKDVAEQQAANARQDARADAVEADLGRVKDRVRVLEGMPPLRRGEREDAP